MNYSMIMCTSVHIQLRNHYKHYIYKGRKCLTQVCFIVEQKYVRVLTALIGKIFPALKTR